MAIPKKVKDAVLERDGEGSRICGIDGCVRALYGRGWCRNHYNVMVKKVGPKALGLPECSLEGCGNTHYGRGYCRKHWERWKKHGDPLKSLIDYDPDLRARFYRKVNTEGGCHVWMRGRDKDGYGQAQHLGKPVRAHRLAYELEHGPIPDGLVVRHKCDNPPCVRIDHLELGTIADNNRDRELRGHGTQGSRNGAAVLNEGQVILIYEALKSGRTQRSLAKEYGVGASTIARISKRQAWREILRRAFPEDANE